MRLFEVCNSFKNKQKMEKLESLVEELIKVMKNQSLNNKSILSMEEACLYACISESKLYKLTHHNIIPYSKPSNGKNYILRKDLEEWMRSNHIQSAEQLEKEVSITRQKRK